MQQDFYNPSIIMLDEWLDFDVMKCQTYEELRSVLGRMAAATAQCFFYTAYKAGEVAHKQTQLASKYGITLKDLAASFNTSVQTISRWRKVYTSLTKNQVKLLAAQGVSVNAVIFVLTDVKTKEDASVLMDALCDGSLSSVKSVEAEYVRILTMRNTMYRQLVCADPADAVEEDPFAASEETSDQGEDAAFIEGEIVEDSEEDDRPNPADKIIEAAEEGESDSSEKDNSSDMKRDAQSMYNLWRRGIQPLLRSLHDISDDMMTQLGVTNDRESVIIGDPETHELFLGDKVNLGQDIQLALERLFEALQWSKQNGCIRRPISFPEGENAETLFSIEAYGESGEAGEDSSI